MKSGKGFFNDKDSNNNDKDSSNNNDNDSNKKYMIEKLNRIFNVNSLRKMRVFKINKWKFKWIQPDIRVNQKKILGLFKNQRFL